MVRPVGFDGALASYLSELSPSSDAKHDVSAQRYATVQLAIRVGHHVCMFSNASRCSQFIECSCTFHRTYCQKRA